MGFKPIFEQERQFIKEQTGIDLPTDCWRYGLKIYLDYTQPKALYELKSENGKLIVAKDRSNGYKLRSRDKGVMYLPKQKKISELIEENKDRLNDMYERTVQLTVDTIEKYHDYKFNVSYSGGKDSTMLLHIWNDALNRLTAPPEWEVLFCNTSNEVADVYRYVKATVPKDKLKILNPKEGYYQWIRRTGRIPSVHSRSCCSTYKEGQVTKAFDAKEKRVQVMGVRSKESQKRSKYQPIMDYDFDTKLFGKSNLPKLWVKFAPMCEEWTDTDVWLYMIMHNIDFCDKYKKGFSRVGCAICPFQSGYDDVLNRNYYPLLQERWDKLLREHYIDHHISNFLHCSIDEWINGNWKKRSDKTFEYIMQPMTNERIKKVSEIKGISEEMARKFWNTKCQCGAKMISKEIAMFYKIFGRQEGQEDNRIPLCKKCLQKKMGWSRQDYNDKLNEFFDDGCNLF